MEKKLRKPPHKRINNKHRRGFPDIVWNGWLSIQAITRHRYKYYKQRADQSRAACNIEKSLQRKSFYKNSTT